MSFGWALVPQMEVLSWFLYVCTLGKKIVGERGKIKT